MFKELFTTKRICRAGIIAALYVALTWSFGQLSVQGLLQIRPGEALTVLPLFYVEAIPALVVGSDRRNPHLRHRETHTRTGKARVTCVARCGRRVLSRNRQCNHRARYYCIFVRRYVRIFYNDDCLLG